MRRHHDPEIEQEFPNLTADNYQLTSDPDPCYNCIAWAAGNNKEWWQWTGSNSTLGGYYWPSGLSNDGSVDTYVNLYAQYGYEVCNDGTFEDGFEKIALYRGFNGRVSHAARQTPEGKWTSKLGRGADIEHETPELLHGLKYGIVVKFLRRPVAPTSKKSTRNKKIKRALN